MSRLPHLLAFPPAAFRFSMVGLVVLLAAPVALGQTMPLPETDLASPQIPITTGPDRNPVEWPSGRVNWLRQLDLTARFLDLWQNRVPGSEFGGMIEAEAGPLGGVIQTDNTLEAIWVWSHYGMLTGTNDYLDNIHDAWIYCQNFPPWLEEGGDGYYRVHNCAWALTTESKYREATGDDSFLPYANTSAEYVRNTPLALPQTNKLNAFVQGWAAGNLYLYGEEMGNQTWMDRALVYGENLITWVNYNPPVQLAVETWAMSSGTLVWGLCNSLFRDDPDRGSLWVENYGAYVDTFQTWYNNPGDFYDWDNSWNVGYVNGHFGMGDVSGDPYYTGIGEKLTRKLLSYDTDDDGGIPATTQDPVTEDMSWVSCYLAKFGIARLLGEPPQRDAGILSFLSPGENDTIVWPVSIPIPIQVQATNFGLEALAGVEVNLTGAAIGSAVIDLDFVEVEAVELHPGWLPGAPGWYELVAYTSVPGDEAADNDSLTIQVLVLDPAAAPLATSAGGLKVLSVTPNPSREVTGIDLRVPAWRPIEVAVFSVEGRRLSAWDVAPGNSRQVRLRWDGRDERGDAVPSGVYFVRASDGRQVSGARFVRLTR